MVLMVIASIAAATAGFAPIDEGIGRFRRPSAATAWRLWRSLLPCAYRFRGNDDARHVRPGGTGGHGAAHGSAVRRS